MLRGHFETLEPRAARHPNRANSTGAGECDLANMKSRPCRQRLERPLWVQKGDDRRAGASRLGSLPIGRLCAEGFRRGGGGDPDRASPATPA